MVADDEKEQNIVNDISYQANIVRERRGGTPRKHTLVIDMNVEKDLIHFTLSIIKEEVM